MRTFLYCILLCPLFSFAENPFLKRFPLHYIETDDSSQKESPDHRFFYLQTDHLPANSACLLFARRLNEKTGSMTEVLTNEKGMVTATDKTPFQMEIAGLSAGEPLELILVPKQQYLDRMKRKPIAALASIVAFPLKVADKSGHSLKIQVASSDGMHFLVAADGFEPREKIEAIVRVNEREVLLRTRATKEGTFGASIAPAPIGQKTGVFQFELRGKTTDSLFVEHQWGPAAFQSISP